MCNFFLSSFFRFELQTKINSQQAESIPLILLQLLAQVLTCSHPRCLDPGVCLNLVACRDWGEQDN